MADTPPPEPIAEPIERLLVDMRRQPDDVTCGPTCLHALYRYYGEDVDLRALVDRAASLEEGGTLAVFLGCDALRRGYRATIYTYDMRAFDPTWFAPNGPDLAERLVAQAAVRPHPKLAVATEAYLDFLRLGGSIRLEDLTPALVRRYLSRGVPVLCGLSATYLYRSAREMSVDGRSDDVAGDPVGHFVVLTGYDARRRVASVSDPYVPNPISEGTQYEVSLARLVCAILLGVLTYDANLLVIEPAPGRAEPVA